MKDRFAPVSMAREPRPSALRGGLRLRFPALTLLLLLSATRPSDAELMVIAQDSAAPSGASGAFDVVVYNAPGSGSVDLSGFSVDLEVPTGSGITLADATAATGAPYAFDGFTITTGFGSAVDMSGLSLTAYDIAVDPAARTLGPGDTFGLAHVLYNVAAGTPAGPVPVTLLIGLGSTDLSDASGASIPFTPVNGTITVRAIPEPASLFILALGSLTLLAVPAIRTGRRADAWA